MHYLREGLIELNLLHLIIDPGIFYSFFLFAYSDDIEMIKDEVPRYFYSSHCNY